MELLGSLLFYDWDICLLLKLVTAMLNFIIAVLNLI
jgi:hypothetical protein